MGSTRLITLVVELSDRQGGYEGARLGNGRCMEWPSKYAGRPTAANLQKWYDKFVESHYPGGANEHFFAAHGFKGIPEHRRARIRNQRTGGILCDIELAQPPKPMFVAI